MCALVPGHATHCSTAALYFRERQPDPRRPHDELRLENYLSITGYFPKQSISQEAFAYFTPLTHAPTVHTAVNSGHVPKWKPKRHAAA